MAVRVRGEKKYSPEEYLAYDDRSERRNEFDSGLVISMAGGSLNHAAIISNVVRAIGNRLGKHCSIYSTDLRVCVEPSERFYYPDVFVVCGRPSLFDKRNDTVTNPILIVEVLSKKTEARDRGEKMLAYRGLESLREYVLISQSNPIVEQFVRKKEGTWLHQATIGMKSKLRFDSIEVELGLDEIFQRIEFKDKDL